MTDLTPQDVLVIGARKPQVGEWAVFKEYLWRCALVERASAACFWANGYDSGGATRRGNERAVFVGPEVVAKRTCEFLMSSEALHVQERRASAKRLEERNAKILADALAMLGAAGVG